MQLSTQKTINKYSIFINHQLKPQTHNLFPSLCLQRASRDGAALGEAQPWPFWRRERITTCPNREMWRRAEGRLGSLARRTRRLAHHQTFSRVGGIGVSVFWDKNAKILEYG